MFFAEAFGAWLLERVADAGRKQLTGWIFGDEQQRELRRAASAAIEGTADELCPRNRERAAHLAMVVDHVFREPLSRVPPDEHVTMLEVLRAGIADQLAVLGDASLTGMGTSSAEQLGIPVARLTDRLTNKLLGEILARGARGGALKPLADHLNHEITHLQNQQLGEAVARLDDRVRRALPERDQPERDVGGAQVESGHAAVYEGATVARLDYRREIDQLLAFYTQSFVGREQELERVAAFATMEEPGYQLVEAPAGFGKTALAAQLIRRHEAGQWDADGGIPALVYFFVREEGWRHTPEAFCLAVNSQLLDLVELPGGVPAGLEAQRSQLLHLWAEAKATASASRPLLLVVDGLDEMASGKVTIAGLLPAELGPYVHVVVTSRANPQPLGQVPLEHPLRQAEVLKLRSLALADIEQLLLSQGGTAPNAARFAGRLLEVTKGEPLLARFISQDVARGGELVLAAQEQAPPTGVRDYFHSQLKQLDARAAGDIAWEVLGVLLVAHGSMTLAELASVLKLPVRQVRTAIAPIHRFLVGRDKVQLMHLELRTVLAEQFTSPADRQVYQRRLLAWCAGYASQDWPTDTPDYVLDNYAMHLREAEDHDLLYRLISRRWMELKAARTYSHQAFARDVLLAVEAADSEEPPNFFQQIRGSLIYATLTSIATNLPSGLLGTLSRLGQLSRAIEYAELIADSEKRASAYRQIADALLEQGKAGEATKAIDQALTAAWAIPNAEPQALALASLALTLSRAGRTEQALTAARAVVDDHLKVWALCRVAEMLARTGHTERALMVGNEALITARAITDDHRRAWVLADVTVSLARIGYVEEAISIAQTIDDADDKAKALAQLATILAQSGRIHQALEVAEQALITTQALYSGWGKDDALLDLTEAFTKVGRTDQAVTVAQTITNGWTKAKALGQVAATLIQSGSMDQANGMAEQALAAAQAVLDDSQRPWVLTDIARTLVKVGRADQALAVLQTIANSGPKTEALARLTEAFAQSGQSREALATADQALATSQTIADYHRKAEALTYVADSLARAGLTDRALTAINQALISAQTVQDGWGKAEALAQLSRTLAQAGHIDQAFSIVHAIPDDGRKAEAQAHLVEVLADAGRTDQALSTAQTINDKGQNAGLVARLAKALANAGHTDRALTIIETIPDADRKTEALAGLALTLAQSGYGDEAVMMAHLVPDDWRRAGNLTQIAIALAQADYIDQALIVAQSIGDSNRKSNALAVLAGIVSRAGRSGQGLTIADQAVAIAQAIPDASKTDSLAGLARTLAQAEYVDQALAITRSISDDWDKAWALAEVAEILARNGRADQALAIAQSIPDNYHKANALSKLARRLTRAGHTEQALATIDQALAVAEALPDDWSKAKALALAARTLTRLGHREQALATINQILVIARTLPDGRSKADALAEVIGTLALAGENDQALTIAQAIPDDWDKAGNLAQVARTLAYSGDTDQAVVIAQAIHDDEYKAWVLAEVAEILARSAQTDQALAIAQSIPDNDRRAKTLSELAWKLAHAGQTDQAITAAKSIPDDWHSSWILGSLAETLAQTGHRDQAVIIAQTIPDSDRKAEALVGVAGKLGDEDLIEQTLDAAQVMTNSDSKARALGKLARTLAQSSHTEQAMTVATRSLTTVRILGREGFFIWLAEMVTAPFPIGNSALLSLYNAIKSTETFWW